jgi:hypothetical protein
MSTDFRGKAIKATLYADKTALINKRGNFGENCRIVAKFASNHIGGEWHSAKLQKPVSLQNIHS